MTDQVHDLRDIPEPDFSTGTVVYALLCNKSAIGIYTSYEKARDAYDVFIRGSGVRASNWYDIKPFKLDDPAMVYSPY